MAVAGGGAFAAWELTRPGAPKGGTSNDALGTASPSTRSWPTHPTGTAPSTLWTYHGQQLPQQPVLAGGGRVLIPGSTVTALDPAADGKVAWTLAGQTAGVEYPPFALLGSTVAVVAKNGDSTANLICYSTSDSREQWRSANLPGTDVLGVLGGDASAIYLHVTGGVIAVDPVSHKSRWSKTWTGFDDSFGQVLITGNTLLRGSRTTEGNSLVAHDTRTGDIRWTYPVPKNDTLVTHEFAADDRCVYLAGLALVALDLNTGKTVFTVPNPDAATDIFGPPAVHDGVVYVAQDLTKTKAVYAFSAKDGKQLWRTTLPSGAADHRSPLVIGSVLFIAAYQDEAGFFALDRATGNLLWTFVDAQRPGRTWQLSTDGNLLYALHGDTLYALPPV